MSKTVEVYIGKDKFMTFDAEVLKEFIDTYNKAIANKKDYFIFNRESFMVPFAKHIIDFVKSKI